jgi:hypothetical protein
LSFLTKTLGLDKEVDLVEKGIEWDVNFAKSFLYGLTTDPLKAIPAAITVFEALVADFTDAATGVVTKNINVLDDPAKNSRHAEEAFIAEFPVPAGVSVLGTATAAVTAVTTTASPTTKVGV